MATVNPENDTGMPSNQSITWGYMDVGSTISGLEFDEVQYGIFDPSYFGIYLPKSAFTKLATGLNELFSGVENLDVNGDPA